MTGQKWKRLVKQQEEKFEAAVVEVEELAATMTQELEGAPSYTVPSRSDDILIEMRGALHYSWRFDVEGASWHDAADVDTAPDNKVWYVQDTSDGGEQYTLAFQTGTKKVWTYPEPVGPYVAVLGDNCYALESEKQKGLWYNRLICLDAETGKERKVLLEMKDHRWNLALIKGQNGCLFVLGNDAGKERLWYITRKNNGELEEITGAFSSFVPVGFSNHTRDVIFFGKNKSKNENGWELVGYQESSLEKIDFNINVPQFFSPDKHILITRSYGKRTYWNLIGQVKKGKDIIGDFEVNPFAVWKNGGVEITIAKAGFPRYLLGDSICKYADASYYMTKSTDGIKVPYVLISSCDKPSALLCIVYGAYGIDTHMNVDRWKPLLARGWALCLALVRGGGDHDDEWAEAARRENKYKSVEDFEACVSAARRHFHLPASVTAVYGRSAGGYLIGSCLARHVDGDLFGGVYTEVPYVDVLNTTANRELPLTELEFDEFGDPRHRIEDFSTLLHLSPVDSLPPGGAPKIFVLDRTALHDKEVFAYESMKWITRLQELDEDNKNNETLPKLLAIAENEGHFATGSAATRERAEDMAVLHGWLRKKSNVGIYEMAHRKNRKETRKNRKNRKGTRKNRRSNRK